MVSALWQRGFRLLWSAQTVSELGSAVTLVAFPLVAIGVLHASNFEVGVITASSNAAWLLVGLPAGVWVDRWPRRPVMIVTDLGRAVLMASIPLAWGLGVLSVAQLITVALLGGVLTVFFNVANTAFLPAVVGTDRLADGNSALQASFAAAGIAGPSLGGGLVQLLGAPGAVIADAASFMVSALCVLRIRTTEPRSPVPADSLPVRRRLSAEVGEGVRYVLGNPLTRVIVSGVTLANFVIGGFDAVVFVFLARQLGLRAAVVGLLFAIGGVGALGGSILAGTLARRFGGGRLLWMSSAVEAAGSLLIPLTTPGWGLAWFVVGMLVLSAAGAAFNVYAITAVQRDTQARLLGRVFASTRLFTRGGIALGGLVGGALASVASPRTALAILMALTVLPPLWMRFSPVGRYNSVRNELSEADH
ncbi:MFS transporter [Rugosimonospora acidiphila]|uniref:MFS transporter n=1 Tax=Rugosimonospora acidiphila TaxID=556531 RepID=A0ABP9ST58_9ACTN